MEKVYLCKTVDVFFVVVTVVSIVYLLLFVVETDFPLVDLFVSFSLVSVFFVVKIPSLSNLS